MNDKNLEYLKKYLPSSQYSFGVEKLKKGISPQYIVGNVDFYGYLFHVDSNVLIPRFETELLVDKAIAYIKDFFPQCGNLHVLDIGTGSGCIAITLNKVLGLNVTACDISNSALDVAKKNASMNDANVCFVESDLFSHIHGKFDVIISNPPYISYDEKIDDMVFYNEPHLALYASDNGLSFYKRILGNVLKYLNQRFMIAFEIGQYQGDMVKNLAYQYLGDVEVILLKDYSNRDRFVFIFSK